MSYSFVTYPSVGASVYAVPFPYLAKTHVLVLDNGAPYTGVVTWLTSSSVQLVPAISAGRTVTIKRKTPTTPLVTFSGGPIASSDLNTSDIQCLYVVEEMLDAAASGLSIVAGTDTNITFTPGGGATAIRSLRQKLREIQSVYDYGAGGLGLTDDAAAFDLADADGSVFVPAGSFKIATAKTIDNPMMVLPGATLTIDGVTLTINGSFIAGRHAVFSCVNGGQVVLGPKSVLEAYPEWWGATTGGADCYAAITAALAAFGIVRLGVGDYYTSATIKMNRGHQKLIGAGSEWEAGQATRLLVASGSLTALQVGPDAQPGSINQFQQQNEVKDLYVARTVAPVIASGCAAVRAQYIIFGHFENVKTNESMRGFECYGCVSTIFDRCAAVRESAGTGAGTDNWRGFYANGFAAIGAAGGNASIYWNFCRAGCNLPALSTGDSNGFYADNNFTDLFIESPETVSCHVGINIQGNTSGTAETNTDCQIKNPINDAFTLYGILVNAVNSKGSVEIIAGYYGGGTGATHAILIQNSYGVSVKGGQFVMLANVTCIAVGLIGCRGCVIDRPLILEATAGPVVLSDSSSCDVRPVVKNFQNAVAGQAVLLTGGARRNYVQPQVLGGAGKVGVGVALAAAADQYNEINCSLIDPACIAGNVLTQTGVAVTARGDFGTGNIASGVMPTVNTVLAGTLVATDTKVNSLGVNVAASAVAGRIDVTESVRLNGTAYTNP